jgi:hypothetical protein
LRAGIAPDNVPFMRQDVNGNRTVPSTADGDPLAIGGTAYEPPHLQDLGTIADLTRGIVPISTDGVAPGSAL